MSRPRITQADSPSAAQRQAILDPLIAFSDPRAGPGGWPEHDLCLVIRDAAGTIAGGAWGRAYYDWLFIELLVVPEDRRGADLGSALLAMAEDQARAWGCHSVWLDTFSFQAPGFYAKKGYSVIGTVPDYPAPHQRFMLSKRLDPEAAPTAHPAVETITAPASHHRDAIAVALERFNRSRVGDGPDAPLALLIEDAEGTVIGGLWGRSYYNWLFIELLFVPESLRGQRIGSALMEMAEAEARVRGCIGVWLDTFSFQAPRFYEAHGYTVFGESADYPAPHKRFFLSKRL
ncbi:GNAT family N-acetyltransferase [Acidisoma cladoniae]|jgi:GNAT superfamily N-acetyltransferase|uniref:GNAT family N-acetyltransferase n=1 Tax=Acidisoma cladoniae TaxID=3040935 RepID=UPI00254E10DD|nr:GNAT family N-acetyltransferase [Acidisoma sp. PAMC 29798]